MIRSIVCLAIAGLVICAGAASAAEPEKEKAAVAAAGKWLALVDGGKYDESWQEASGYFRQAVGRDRWVQMVKAVRGPLGAAVSRNEASAVYTTSLPGAPDGEYVVITFSTSFEHKKSATETITPMLDRDGAWRVSGYYIK